MNVGTTVTAAGFWVGTILPIAYLPVLLGGLRDPGDLAILVSLIAVNVLALVIGRDYRADA